MPLTPPAGGGLLRGERARDGRDPSLGQHVQAEVEAASGPFVVLLSRDRVD